VPALKGESGALGAVAAALEAVEKRIPGEMHGQPN